jgi:hypothetical protein
LIVIVNPVESGEAAAALPDSSQSEEEQPKETQSGNASLPSLPSAATGEVSFEDRLFPFSQASTAKPRCERGLLFIRCVCSPLKPIHTSEAAQSLIDA